MKRSAKTFDGHIQYPREKRSMRGKSETAPTRMRPDGQCGPTTNVAQGRVQDRVPPRDPPPDSLARTRPRPHRARAPPHQKHFVAGGHPASPSGAPPARTTQQVCIIEPSAAFIWAFVKLVKILFTCWVVLGCLQLPPAAPRVRRRDSAVAGAPISPSYLQNVLQEGQKGCGRRDVSREQAFRESKNAPPARFPSITKM